MRTCSRQRHRCSEANFALHRWHRRSTSLTSKRQKSKTSAHGMGGVGKTTVACALVHDEEILSSFEKVVWVSVGLESNIRELQDSIYEQVVGMAIPATATSPGLVLKALADGARRSKILLVLDDVWDARHEKSLNCIDNNTSSKLLITTRIRGLTTHEVALCAASRRRTPTAPVVGRHRRYRRGQRRTRPGGRGHGVLWKASFNIGNLRRYGE